MSQYSDPDAFDALVQREIGVCACGHLESEHDDWGCQVRERIKGASVTCPCDTYDELYRTAVYDA